VQPPVAALRNVRDRRRVRPQQVIQRSSRLRPTPPVPVGRGGRTGCRRAETKTGRGPRSVASRGRPADPQVTDAAVSACGGYLSPSKAKTLGNQRLQGFLRLTLVPVKDPRAPTAHRFIPAGNVLATRAKCPRPTR
jgi:hypothetical protein